MVPRPTQRAAAPQALRVPPLHPAVSDARQGDGAQYDPQVRAARLLRPYGMVGDRRPCGPSRRADHRGARDAELHPRDESGLCGLARASRLLHVCPAYPGGGDMDVRRLGIATVARSDWGHTGENDERIKEILRLKYNKNLNINGGIKLALDIFKEILGKNFELSRFDVAYVNKEDKKVKKLDENSLKKIY